MNEARLDNKQMGTDTEKRDVVLDVLHYHDSKSYIPEAANTIEDDILEYFHRDLATDFQLHHPC
ncbi:hypothetical protein N7541_001356 [Penicillium brevicompactum]|uniref:Uncharacterized protein n=1 Tax=Penicillium brevicompactum TaxID=5074 RepID=A0A9W9RW22_PENBR|nr:hypothetical protein N7541_001356 [Penicillium brevicompactum]